MVTSKDMVLAKMSYGHYFAKYYLTPAKNVVAINMDFLKPF